MRICQHSHVWFLVALWASLSRSFVGSTSPTTVSLLDSGSAFTVSTPEQAITPTTLLLRNSNQIHSSLFGLLERESEGSSEI